MFNGRVGFLGRIGSGLWGLGFGSFSIEMFWTRFKAFGLGMYLVINHKDQKCNFLNFKGLFCQLHKVIPRIKFAKS